MLSLPSELRDAFKQPFGPVYTDPAALLSDAGRPVIAVGDVVAYHLRAAGHSPAVAVIDGRTEREAVDDEVRDALSDPERRRDVENEPGRLGEPLLAALADAVAAHTDDLTLLVNNAGGLFSGALARTGTTSAGIERTFAINHLAPFALTHALVPQLAAGDGGRVVTTASEAHRGGRMRFDAVRRDDVRGFPAYNRSKLANIMFTSALARRLDAAAVDVTATTLHPGVIPGSGFMRELPRPLAAIGRRVSALPQVDTPVDGAANVLVAALGADVPSGAYISDLAPATPSEAARDERVQERLWTTSEELTGRTWPPAGLTAE